MTAAKTLLKIFAALILVVALVVAAAVALFDPNDYKPEMIKAVTQASGRTVHIDGRIEWSLFPYLGVSAGPLAMDNATGSGDFARIRRVGFKVAVWPLLHQKVVIDRVFLDGLELNLESSDKGNNWDDLLPQGSPSPATESGAPLPAALNIGAVSVSDGVLTYRDRQTSSKYRLGEIHLETTAIRFAKAFDVSAGFALTTAAASALEFDFHARVKLDPQRGRYALRESGFSVKGQWSHEAIDLDGKASATYDHAAGKVEVPDLALRLHNLRVGGNLQMARQQRGWRGNAVLQIADFSPREWLTKLTGHAPQSADPKVLEHASAKLKARFSGPKIQATLSALKLDDTTFTGSLGIEGKSVPAITFKLQGDTLDLDRYRSEAPPNKPESPPTPAREAKHITHAGQSPASNPAPFDLNGDFDFGRFKAARLTTKNIHMHFAAHRGVVTVKPVSGDFYAGKITASMRIDSNVAKLPLHFQARIKDVQAESLSQDLLGSPRVLGRGRAALDIRTDLGTDPIASLNGGVHLKIDNGAIKGIDILQQLREASAHLSGKPAAPVAEQDQQTQFTELELRVDVEDGIASLTTLDLHSPALKLSGSGEVDLPAQTLNLLLEPQLIEVPQQTPDTTTASTPPPAEGLFDKLRGVPIPIRIGGTISQPSYGVDLMAAINAATKAKLQHKAKNELGKALNSLFGKKKKKQKRSGGG